jgi:PAS domain S-box-containing protein
VAGDRRSQETGVPLPTRERPSSDTSGGKAERESFASIDLAVRYRSLFETARDAIFLIRGGVFVECNDRTLELFRCRRRSILGREPALFSPLVQPDGRDSVEAAAAWTNAAMEKGSARFDWRHLRADGTFFDAEVSLNRVEIRQERYLQAVVRDITEARWAEALLTAQRDLGLELARCRELPETLERCLETALKVSEMDCGGVYLRDPATGTLDLVVHRGISDTFFAAVGHYEPASREATLILEGGTRFLRVRDLPDAGNIRKSEGLLSIALVPIRGPGGVLACINLASRRTESISPQHRRAMESMADLIGGVIARIRAEQAQWASESRYRGLFEQAGDGIVVMERDARVIEVNPSFLEMTGYGLGELAGHKLPEFYDEGWSPDVTRSFGAILAGGNPVRHRRFRCKGGSHVDLEGRGRLLPDTRIMVIFRDITESLRRDEERERAARLESLGNLAGGIAHDFNNILTSILGYVELGQIQAGVDSTAGCSLHRAVSAIERARKLTQQLLTFSRGGAPVLRSLRPTLLVRESAEFALRGSKVACQFDIAEDLCSILADEGQIGQVLHNLFLNAVQAMEEGGVIRVVAGNRTIGVTDPDGLEPGPYVRISIEDRGGGITPEVLPRIFDPYFTTKPKGTGLGLSTAYRIVKLHRGHLAVEVLEGLGSIFSVILPASPLPAETRDLVEPGTRSFRGRVLVMDDEPDIRELLAAVLSMSGFEVDEVPDGEGAVDASEAALASGRPYRLAIMDLTIPGRMGGLEAVGRLKRADPALKAIVSSGYSTDSVMARHLEAGFDGVVVKPYRRDLLLAEIERVLALPTQEPS